MPRREGGWKRMELLPMEERLKHICDPGQRHWHRLAAAKWGRGAEVLDVGAGAGESLEVFRAHGAAHAVGIDPLPCGIGVCSIPLEQIPDASYDIVTAFDVIEHVEDDAGFLAHLERVARRLVFFSTPNWEFWGCANEFHAREYTPSELVALLGARHFEMWTSGDAHEPMRIALAKDALHNFGVLIRRTP